MAVQQQCFIKVGLSGGAGSVIACSLDMLVGLQVYDAPLSEGGAVLFQFIRELPVLLRQHVATLE